MVEYQYTRNEKWLCIVCRFLLGYVEDKRIVRIKRRDLYVTVTDGSVCINCPRCGKVNELIDEKPDVNSEGKEELANGIERTKL